MTHYWLTPNKLTAEDKELLGTIYLDQVPDIRPFRLSEAVITKRADAWVFFGNAEKVLKELEGYRFGIGIRVYWVQREGKECKSEVFATGLVLEKRLRKLIARKGNHA